MNNSWEVILEEDENGEILLPFPPELIQRYHWLEGDQIDFDIKENHVVITNLSAKLRENTADNGEVV